MQKFDVTTWGARGTRPATGQQFEHFGGDTACIEIDLGDRVIVLDAGSGIVGLGRALIDRPAGPLDLFISHAHMDHIIGLPFFAPLFAPDREVTLWFAGTEGAPDAEALLDTLVQPPLLPFTRAAFRCKLALRQLPRAGSVVLETGCEVSTVALNHPGGNTGIKVAAAGRSLAYCCDFEPDGGTADADLRGFLSGSDMAVLDTTYTPEEYPEHRGYGHSDWMQSGAAARAAGVGLLGLFHHAPDRTDDALRHIARAAAQVTPALAMRQGETIDLMRGRTP